MTPALGFVGLGAMGSRKARRLLDGGFTLHGYNRTPAKAADLVAAGMTLAASPREVAERAEAVFSAPRQQQHEHGQGARAEEDPHELYARR